LSGLTSAATSQSCRGSSLAPSEGERAGVRGCTVSFIPRSWQQAANPCPSVFILGWTSVFRFNGFPALWPSRLAVLKLLETVCVPLAAGHTPMNGGVNESPCGTGQTPPPGVGIMRTAGCYRQQQFSLWAATPRRVRAPGLHPPQNRPRVGRVPSPGVPCSSIMRIAGSGVPVLTVPRRQGPKHHRAGHACATFSPAPNEPLRLTQDLAALLVIFLGSELLRLVFAEQLRQALLLVR